MENNLEVKYGSIYTRSGTCIDNMAIVIDKDAGLLKYGDSEKTMDKYFDDMVFKYKQSGCGFMVDHLVYLKFDRYCGILSVEEVCTFVNYMSMCSATGNKIMKMLEMNNEDLKKEISKYKELGY